MEWHDKIIPEIKISTFYAYRVIKNDAVSEDCIEHELLFKTNYFARTKALLLKIITQECTQIIITKVLWHYE